MCTIAGYAGTRRAAPILIEMMAKEEFMDSGLSTGIATVCDGKLYTAKVTGSLEKLLRETDAANFPGSVGIIHSRTAGNLVSHAHPFTSEDGDLAMVLNGTMREVKCPGFESASNSIMKSFFERGFTIKSACEMESAPSYRRLPNGMAYHDSEPYALMIGDEVHGVPEETIRPALIDATFHALTRMPADVIMLSVHAKAPDTITIGTVTRPMSFAHTDGESFLATCAIALPEEASKNNVVFLPPTSVSQVSSRGLFIASQTIPGVRVEAPDYRVAAKIYERMEAILKERPMGVPEFPVWTDWRDVWQKPYVDCRFANPEGLLKPYASILYEALYAFHREGRLREEMGLDKNGNRLKRFYLV